MEFFFVGLAMRNRTHDYGAVHAALFAMKAHRVSTRIWLCAVTREAHRQLLGAVASALSDGDEMLVTEAPAHMRAPRLIRDAA